MDFGPHASFSDPGNLAMAGDRIRWLKSMADMRVATPVQLAELERLQRRLADHYQAHVAHFVNRALGVEPATAERSELAELGV